MTRTRTWTLWALMTMLWPTTGRGLFLRPALFQGIEPNVNADVRWNPGSAALPAFSPTSDVAADVLDRMPTVGSVLVDLEIQVRNVSSRSA